MLIHGRLLVTQNGLMLDEVKSLLQKALRRQEHTLTFQAAKELLSNGKDQLKWPNIVTFMFEDHCLNHVTVFEKLFNLYRKQNKLGCVELISKCYTCRHSACLQVVAIDENHTKYDDIWADETPADSNMKCMVTAENGGILCDNLLMNITRSWRKKKISDLVSLFGLVNMAAKVEGRKLTKAGLAALIDRDIKSPNLYHLVLSLLHKNTEDEYMKRIVYVCFKFASIPDTPQGLILFTALSQLMYKDVVMEKPILDTSAEKVDWDQVGKLETMPEWAVDKHTYRGKFGKSSKHLFLKKFSHMNLSDDQLNEFHGERPKADIRHFFDVGCVCANDILPENPIWEGAKAMYLKQKPSMQKCAKMTKLLYNDLKESKSKVMMTKDGAEYESEKMELVELKAKRKRGGTEKGPDRKKAKLEKGIDRQEDSRASSSCTKGEQSTRTEMPNGPLLQLPTGSGKVYTVLDLKTEKVWKGPYKSVQKKNLCIFYHRAMNEIFGDSHTMQLEEKSPYLVFPLLKSEDADMKVTNRAYYDCISKKEISAEDGQFVERSSLGIVQLHKLSKNEISRLPVSIWVHFAWRYVLNVGDTGLYNAIATKDLGTIYGIDMEERRNQVKGNDVLNMLFGKLPRKEVVPEIQKAIATHVEDFHASVSKEIDFEKLEGLFKEYGLSSEVDMCKQRIKRLLSALESLCKIECGV